jgi:hypothetical protein
VAAVAAGAGRALTLTPQGLAPLIPAVRCASLRALLGLSTLIGGCAAPPSPAPPPEPSPPPPVASAPAPPAPPATIQLGGGCEEAKTAYVNECQHRPASCVDAARPTGAASVTSLLNDGAYLAACGSPPSTAVRICAAIRGGHALAVTVTTTPGDAHLADCIGKRVQGLDFPVSPRLDVTSTSFAAQ